MELKFSLGWNRVSPPHEVIYQKPFIQCTELQNYICKDNRIKKIGGTVAYNNSVLANSIVWAKRSYHKLGDNTFVKRTLCFSNGVLYSGDDVTGTLTSRQIGLSPESIMTDMTIQVSGNSILYIFTGEDRPYKYNGNGSYVWEKTVLDADITMGAVHLERGWYIHKNTSFLDYSIPTDNPEEIEDTIIVGNDKDSVNMAMALGADEAFYVFKNNSIYQLYGRTPSTFQVRLVTNKYGLAARKGICPVGSGFIFLNEFDKELYFFGGTEASIQSLTEKNIKLREIIDLTQDSISNVRMVTHNDLFRFTFQHRESAGDYNNCELVYTLSEPTFDGLPKWSLIKGSNVASYSVWNQQGDKNELVTGRSDTGKLMYHNQGWDFDGTAIETIARTGEVTLSEDMVCKLLDIYVKFHPGSVSNKPLFRYYMNGRFTDRGEENQSMEGETRTVGIIKVQKSYLFNDSIAPLTEYSRGNSVSFEVYDNNLSNEMELYSISFQIRKLYKIRNQLV